MKKPDSVREWMIFIFTAIAIFATACFAYEALVQRVGVVEKDITEMKPEVKIHSTAITEIKKDIFYIVNGIDDIKEGFGMPVKRRSIRDPNN